MSMISHRDVFDLMEQWANKSLAYDWDNVGLQVGSTNTKTKKILITLDVLESVVDEAIEKGVNLIIAHHPLLFKPLNQINIETVKGKIIHKLIKNNITVYVAHTNLDIADGGVNDLLCHALGLKNIDHLTVTDEEKLVKFAVFVPTEYVEIVRDAMGKAGAGHIGNYSHCSFTTSGKGAFKPLEGSNPFIGHANNIEYVEEYKLETVVNEKNITHVIQAVKKVHPYEEVAYDVYPLRNEGKKFSLGRVGYLEKETTLKQFCQLVKKAYSLPAIKVTGNMDKKINKVAIVGGSGEKFVSEAIKQKADVLITGDVTFHIAQDAKEMGFAIIDAGHYIEHIMKEATKNYLHEQLQNSTIEVVVSETNTDPFQFV